MIKFAPQTLALFVVISLLGAGCSSSERPSNASDVQRDSRSSVVMRTAQSHGTAYTTEEAGIPVNYEDKVHTLVYLKQLNVKDGRVYATVDPVRFIDCNKEAALHQPLPKECLNHPEVGFSIENDDPTTVTYEMATSSGPFFLNRIDGETTKQVKTMDLPTIQGLLNGTISPSTLGDEYYDPNLRHDPVNAIPANLFYIIEKTGIIEKMVQKYRA